MSTTLGVVELDSAGQDWSHSPRRLANRRIGNQNFLTWVVRRVSDAELLDRIVVVSDSAALPALPADVEVYYSDADPLQRLAEAVTRYRADSLVRVRLTQPLIDPILVDRLVAETMVHLELDYLSYGLSSGVPAAETGLGVGAEWCRSAAILKANQLASEEDERFDSTAYLHGHPETFAIRMIPVPKCLDRQDVRLTVDCAEDWEHVESIYDALGPELDWQGIADLLDQHPQLRARMACLNRSAAV